MAALVIARLERLPTVAAAAIALGLLESGVRFNSDTPAAAYPIMAAVMFVVLLVQRTSQSRRDNDAASTWRGAEEVRPLTEAERRNPKIVDQSRRTRIAKGAGVDSPEVSGMLKQFDAMMPMLKAMAGKGVGGRMQALNDLRKQGAFNPGAQINKPKGSTGKRLTNEEKKRLAKQREKELRKRKREGKS